MARIYALRFDGGDGFLEEFDPLEAFRLGVTPSGVIDGVNASFTTPEVFVASGGIVPRVYRNGQLQLLGVEYTISESGGVGTGFDTIEFVPACTPKLGEHLRIDYVAA